jgi:DNA-binding transcriptional LysR family regulator
MELRHLRYFVAVAEELSFSRAARRLHISQPPLSQQIRDLEQETGLQLFDRSRRKIVLTAAGRDFLVDARVILESVSRAERNSGQRAEGRLGHIVVGVNTTLLTPHTFGNTLREFQKQNAGIAISLIDGPSVRLIEALMSASVDVAFLRPPLQKTKNLATQLMRREAMRLAVPLGHKLAKKPRILWKDLADEPLIIINPATAGNFYDEFNSRCRSAGFEPRIRHYVDNFYTQFWMISAGLGIAPMPTTPETFYGVTSVALPRDAPVYDVSMMWRRDDPSPAIRRFTEFMRR